MSEFIHLAFIIHFFTTVFMTGLIWVIQWLHYPSYHFIDLLKFKDYQNFHTHRITLIVGPVMLTEVFTGAYLTIQNNWSPMFIWNFIGLCIIWVSTLIFSIPSHNKLALGFNQKAISFLIGTNWIRTICWTLRSFLLMFFLLAH